MTATKKNAGIPKAELGKTSTGRVVNITKFGAFVNILPGRDGLVHISKLGGGRRINAVEDAARPENENVTATVQQPAAPSAQRRPRRQAPRAP